MIFDEFIVNSLAMVWSASSVIGHFASLGLDLNKEATIFIVLCEFLFVPFVLIDHQAILINCLHKCRRLFVVAGHLHSPKIILMHGSDVAVAKCGMTTLCTLSLVRRVGIEWDFFCSSCVADCASSDKAPVHEMVDLN